MTVVGAMVVCSLEALKKIYMKLRKSNCSLRFFVMTELTGKGLHKRNLGKYRYVPYTLKYLFL